MVSSQELYNACLKKNLHEAKLCYIMILRNFFLLWKPRNLEAWRINCTAKEAKATGMRFLSDFHCNKNIFTFLLQISQSEWFLTFMLNVKNCFNVNLLKLWGWYSSTKNLKKQQQQDGNPCFMFTIIFVHKIIVMIDDTFGRDTCLVLCQQINLKGL